LMRFCNSCTIVISDNRVCTTAAVRVLLRSHIR
jgi:hypothetical protein